MVLSSIHLFSYEEKGYHSSLLFESWHAFLLHKNLWCGCSGQTQAKMWCFRTSTENSRRSHFSKPRCQRLFTKVIQILAIAVSLETGDFPPLHSRVVVFSQLNKMCGNCVAVGFLIIKKNLKQTIKWWESRKKNPTKSTSKKETMWSQAEV